METWYACSEADVCVASQTSPVGDQVRISRSVGAGGANIQDDVRAIQKALNSVPASQGGAAPPLAPDGFIGPLTISAIRHFQKVQFPGWTPDARIDPGQKTLARINDLLSSGPVPNPGPSPVSKEGSAARSLVEAPPKNPHTDGQSPEIKKAYDTIPEALGKIRDARHRLELLQAELLGLGLRTTPSEGRKIADWNFKLDRAANPSDHVAKILGVYTRMEETLVMAGRPTTPFQFFLPSKGSALEATAAAYTTLGGYYYGIGEIDKKEYRNAVYITPQFANKVFAASILIHEMAHYCGGKEKSPDTIEHRASPRPAPRGRRLEDGRHDYAGMTADEAYRNAQSYQAYCDPRGIGMPP